MYIDYFIFALIVAVANKSSKIKSGQWSETFRRARVLARIDLLDDKDSGESDSEN